MPDRTATRNIFRDMTDRESTGFIKKRRWGVYENFEQLPLLNADYAVTNLDPTSAQVALAIRGNKNFEVIGVNATTADVAYSPHGGVNIATAANNNDSTILRPQADTLMTCLHETSGVNFGTEDETWFEAIVRFDTLTNTTFFAGLRLTDQAAEATPAAILTADANAAFFMFSTAGATSTVNFTAVSNVATIDTEKNLGVRAAINTDYALRIEIASNRVATFYINDRPLWHSPQLTNDIDFIPIVGVLAEGATSMNAHIRSVEISRLLAVN